MLKKRKVTRDEARKMGAGNFKVEAVNLSAATRATLTYDCTIHQEGDFAHPHNSAPCARVLKEVARPFDATTDDQGRLFLAVSTPTEIFIRKPDSPSFTPFPIQEKCTKIKDHKIISLHFASPEMLGVVSTLAINSLETAKGGKLMFSLWSVNSGEHISAWDICYPWNYSHPNLAFATKNHLYVVNTVTNQTKSKKFETSIKGTRITLSKDLVVLSLDNFQHRIYSIDLSKFLHEEQSETIPIVEGETLIKYHIEQYFHGTDNFGFPTINPFAPNTQIRLIEKYFAWLVIVFEEELHHHLFILNNNVIVFEMYTKKEPLIVGLVGNPNLPQLLLATDGNLKRLSLQPSLVPRPLSIMNLPPSDPSALNNHRSHLYFQLAANMSRASPRVLSLTDPSHYQSFNTPGSTTSNIFKFRLLGQQLCRQFVIEFQRLKIALPDLSDNQDGFSLRHFGPLEDALRMVSEEIAPFFPALFQEMGSFVAIEALVVCYRSSSSLPKLCEIQSTRPCFFEFECYT